MNEFCMDIAKSNESYWSQVDQSSRAELLSIFHSKLEDVEKLVILGALKARNYNRTHTARSLGISIRTLQRKLQIYGLSELGLDEKYLKHLSYFRSLEAHKSFE